jgi:hypothetical protein
MASLLHEAALHVVGRDPGSVMRPGTILHTFYPQRGRDNFHMAHVFSDWGAGCALLQPRPLNASPGVCVGCSGLSANQTSPSQSCDDGRRCSKPRICC